MVAVVCMIKIRFDIVVTDILIFMLQVSQSSVSWVNHFVTDESLYAGNIYIYIYITENMQDKTSSSPLNFSDKYLYRTVNPVSFLPSPRASWVWLALLYTSCFVLETPKKALWPKYLFKYKFYTSLELFFHLISSTEEHTIHMVSRI